MKTQKQRIFSILAILTMAVILTCIFAACDKVGAQDSSFKVTIHPNNGQDDIVWDVATDIPSITKDGYHVVGYYLDAELTISTSLESLKATGITKNIDVYVKWEEIACNHVVVVDEMVAPTCTAIGLTEGKHCSKCGKILQAQIKLPALGHIGGILTCTVQATCIRCHEKYGEPLGHDYSTEWTIDVLATCTQNGSKSHHCTRCTGKKDVTEITATGHVGGKATCEEQAVCEVCHEKYGEPLGHDFSNEWKIDKEATCTEKGSKSHHCTRCEVKSDVTEIPTIEHSESDWIIDKETTCTEDGSKHTECTVCHTTIKTEKISALGHTGGTATCTEQTICERCGNKYGESLGHDYKSIVTDPTCTKQGYTTHTCTRCKHSYMDTYIDALGHKETIDEAVEPTCTTAGLTAGKHCSVCGEVLQAQNEIPALGHDLEHHDGKEAICTEKGWKEYDTCKREGCDHTTYEEIPALGHKYGDIIPKTEPTCTENGVEAHYKCSVCNKVFKNDEHKTETTLDELTIAISPNAHNFGNWIKNEGADTHTRVCSYNSKHTKTENCQGGTATCTEQAVCEKCNAKYGELANHEYENGVCIVCGIRRQSEGLEYSLNSDGNGYTVTGIGTCTDKELIIPSEYNAKPVTSIGSYAFFYCTGLTSVTIGNGVTSIGEHAFYGCNGLTSVTIGDSVTSIGERAFESCTGLTSVTIPDSVTNIGDYAFEGCTGLTSVTIGNSVTSIGSAAFWNCTGLTSVTIPDSVTTIDGNAFSGCIGLTSVTIGKGVTSIGWGAFRDCTGLTSITIGGSVTSIGGSAFDGTAWYNNQPDGLVYAGKVAYKYKGTMPSNTSIVLKEGTLGIAESAFSRCTGLTSITIPDSVTSIGDYAFRGCTGLTSVTIPDSVTSIGYMAFDGCTGLTSVTIPDSVTSIDVYAFSGCTGLTSVTIPDSVTSIGDEAFRGCTGLTSVTIGNGVTSIGSLAFADCTGLTSIIVAKGNTKYHSAGNCLIETESKTLIAGCKNSIIPTDGSVTSIGNVAFSGCTGLTSVTIPNSVTSIGSSAFSDCTGLTSVTIGGSVTSIGDWAFSGCTGLTSVTIPGSVTSIGNNAFYNCYSLIEVYNKSTLSITAGSSSNGYVAYYAKNVYTNEGESKLTTDENGYVIYTDGDEKILVAYHGTNTELALPSYITKINQYAFSDCISLTSITIPDSVTSIGNSVFSGCTGLTSITVAKGNTKYHSAGNCLIETGSKTLIAGCKNSIIPTDGSVTSIGNYAFEGCTGLTSITIPDSVTSIGSWAFYGCNKIQTIYITDIGAWCNIAGLGNLMSYGASNKKLYINNELATSITIPNGVKAIPSYAFYNCTGLTSVTIPNSVTSIGYEAFRGCTGLTSVTIPGNVTSIGDYAFSGCTGLTSITFKGTIKQWNAIYKSYNWKDTVPATQVVCTDGTISI